MQNPQHRLKAENNGFFLFTGFNKRLELCTSDPIIPTFKILNYKFSRNNNFENHLLYDYLNDRYNIVHLDLYADKSNITLLTIDPTSKTKVVEEKKEK